MRKLIMFILLGILALPLYSQVSDSDSATITISGVVGDFVSLNVTTESAATNLSLSTNQTSPLKIATVTETSNTAYEVEVTSGNGFVFSNSGNDTHPYTLYYDGSVVAQSGDVVSSGTNANNLNKDVSVTYSEFNGAPGVYSDAVTFTISSTQ
jgi:hypothetical protein